MHDLHELERLLNNVVAREAFRGHCIPAENRAGLCEQKMLLSVVGRSVVCSVSTHHTGT